MGEFINGFRKCYDELINILNLRSFCSNVLFVLNMYNSYATYVILKMILPFGTT